MTTKLLLVLSALTLVAGCGGVPYSDPYGASPETSAKADCENAGGRWHSTTAVCERPRR